MNIKIKDISDGGIDLAFIAYPGMLATLTWPNLWSILFFIMLIFIGIDSVFATIDAMVYYVKDLFPFLKKYFSH